MGKLTKAQREVLERIGRGDVLLFSSGRYAATNFIGDPRSLHPATVQALHKAGLTEQVRYGAALTVGLYRIVLTDAGRAALREPS